MTFSHLLLDVNDVFLFVFVAFENDLKYSLSMSKKKLIKNRFLLLDNGGETFDRYTLYDTKSSDRVIHYLGFSENPYHPQGFGQHGFVNAYEFNIKKLKHVGKPIELEDLPPSAKKCAESFISESLVVD
jgi:hypothetical protein